MRVEIKALLIVTVRSHLQSVREAGEGYARRWNMGFGFIARREDDRINILDAVAL